MLNLSLVAATIVTARLLKVGRSDDEVKVKFGRYNLRTRIDGVKNALHSGTSINDAAQKIVESGFFTGKPVDELANVLEVALNRLEADMESLGFAGLAVLPELEPVHPVYEDEDDIGDDDDYDDEVEDETDEDNEDEDEEPVDEPTYPEVMAEIHNIPM